MQKRLGSGLLLILLLCPWATAADDATPQTADDPNIPVEALRILVRPMTLEQLAVEADAWFGHVTELANQIAQRELEQRRAAKQAAQQPTTAPADDAGSDADANEAAERRKNLLQELSTLRERQTALIDRFDIVLTSFEAKGGDTEKYRSYLRILAGISVDVSDATAAWAVISGWLTSKEGGIRWGINILQFFATLVVFWIVAAIIRVAVRRAMNMMKNVSSLLRDFTVNMTHRLIMLAGLLVAVSMLEVKLTPVLAILGAARFVIAFALQGTLSNLASGLMILVLPPLRRRRRRQRRGQPFPARSWSP
jgi:small conductance mechanosensitive channel